jgi:hypothetical protein
VVWGEGCCCCGSWSSANRCGVKVDVWLWSCPVNVKGTEVVAKRDSSMRRLIEAKFSVAKRPRFRNRILSEFPVHV